MSGREREAGIRRTRLDSGIRVVSEFVPELRSVALGFWVGTGARDESAPVLGASHFLEHLLFKGTATRTAPEIARAVESVGGEMNAFTTHEFTAFYVRVPDEHAALAVEILSDVVWAPALRPHELEAERSVILEEIRMRDDAPEEVLHERLAASLFPGHPLGRPVLGSRDSIEAVTREAVAGYHGLHYHPANVVAAAAGNVEHDRVVELIARHLDGLAGDRPPRARDELPALEPLAVVPRSTEQAHIALGLRALPRDDPDRYALTVLNQALGGGMASRLFQEVRERRGLAYSVFSYRSAFEETGALALYAAATPCRAVEVLRVLEAELERLVSDGGVSEPELDAAKGHLAGSTALGVESSASRMHRLGRSEVTLGEVPTLDELVAAVSSVTTDDVARVVDRVIATGDRALTVVGPCAPEDFA